MEESFVPVLDGHAIEVGLLKQFGQLFEVQRFVNVL